MYIRCWGSRGSLPVSGKQFDRYGGDTTCMEIRSKKGDVIVVDAGTGIHGLGLKLAKARVRKINLLFTHAHFDHIMGFPFFNPIYQKGVRLTVHGCAFKFQSYKNILKGVMCAPYFPVELNNVAARLDFKNHGHQPFTIGTITVRPIFLSHPNGGLGFRFEEDGASFVFLTDNELGYHHQGGRSFQQYAEFARGANLLIHDAEFSERDYPFNRGFGHSVCSDVVKVGIAAGAQCLGLFHHNRERTDIQVDALAARAKKLIFKNKSGMKCCAVGNTFEITL